MAFRALLFVVVYVLAATGAALGLHALELIELRNVAALIWVLAVITLAAIAALYLHLVRPTRLTPAQLGFAKPRWRLLHLLWQIPVVIVASGATSALVVLGSAAVFAAVHVAPLVLAYVFVLGLGLGWLRWFHRNLWASVVAHAVNNTLSLTVVLLAV